MQEATQVALRDVLQPITSLALDAGLSVSDLISILQEVAVASVAASQLRISGRTNISGIAASTGINRQNVSRILRNQKSRRRTDVAVRTKSTDLILAAWHREPRFTTASGHPADLKLYGPGPTFETLVRRFGQGIPTRALLDELIRARAVEVMESGMVRAQAAFAVERGFSPAAIKSLGERAAELLSTLVKNMREPEVAEFVATVVGYPLAPNSLPLLRKEISHRGTEFLADIGETLAHESTNVRMTSSSRLSVTVYCSESKAEQEPKEHSLRRRRNFKRE